MKGIRRYRSQLKSQLEDEKYSTGNMINNTVLTLCDDRGVTCRVIAAFHDVWNCQLTALYTGN